MEKGRSRAYIACHIGSENIHWGKEAQRDFEFITMAFVEVWKGSLFMSERTDMIFDNG